MKIDKLVDAIGEIDENRIRNARTTPDKTKRISFKRALALVAAIILCITISVPVFEDENQTLFVSGNGISENTVSANAVP